LPVEWSVPLLLIERVDLVFSVKTIIHVIKFGPNCKWAGAKRKKEETGTDQADFRRQMKRQIGSGLGCLGELGQKERRGNCVAEVCFQI
jgi:hypothetical protein